MPDINLLQTQSSDPGEAVNNVARVFARLLLIAVIGVIVAYAVLYFIGWRSQSTLDKTNMQVQSRQAETLGNVGREELVTRQEQLKELETLVDQHVYWSYLMPELARVTLQSAQYTNIEANSDGKLTMTVTLPSYQDIEKYLQIFDLPEFNQQFSNVRIVGIEKTQSEGSLQTQLTVQLMFNPAFIKGRT